MMFTVAQAQLSITEFMASNSQTLTDDFGEYEDWIEIYNSSPTNVNLFGWALTDDAGNLGKWIFPATTIAPGQHLLIWASNRDRRTASQPLHTNFKLSAGGEYLALVRPNGTIATHFSPTYPPQIADVAYGSGVDAASVLFVATNHPGRVKVPTDGTIPFAWVSNSFNDASWTPATNGIGFTTESNLLANTLAAGPLGYWRLNEATTNSGASNLGSLGAAANAAYTASMAVNVAGPQPPSFTGFETANTGVRFNGSNSKMEVPYHAALNPNGPFSVEFWVKPAANPGGFQCPLASINFSGSSRDGYLFYQNAGTAWEFRVGNNLGYVATASGGVPTLGSWAHLVGVYDGTTARLYVNGTSVANVTLSGAFVPNATQVFRLGATGNATGTSYFNGDVDEVSFYNRALSGPEISDRYNLAANSSFAYAGLIKTDIRTAMLGVNASAYIRFPFVVTNLQTFDNLTLRVRFDDGFLARINGATVASTNAPAIPDWNSPAPTSHATSGALNFKSFNITGEQGALIAGTNILSFQGFNVAATNSDFLLQAELEGTQWTYLTNLLYFVTPTPGDQNNVGVQSLGPILTSHSFHPQLPGTNDHLTITCRVSQAFAPVGSVTLNWRVMFGVTNTAPMFDDGAHGDGAAGDGVYGATINKSNYASSQMVRWFVSATDTAARASRLPAFLNPTNSAEYFGAVIQANYVTSTLPVLHLFAPASILQPGPTTSQIGADSESGGRVSAYYDGEFYDNIYMELRGNSTAGYNKKSHSFKFNTEQKFRHPESIERIRKTSFTADYPDPTYLRQGLSFWLASVFGAPGPFYNPWRLQLNGQFYQLANHNDVVDSELLERLGYDDDGALYKSAGTIQPSQFSTGGFDKKTRTWENNSDYTAMANAISESLPLGQRMTNVFDRFDLPEIISYMVVARFVHENDDVWANLSVYHDNDGDDLWRIIPFDMNLSWGAAYVDSSELIGIQSTNDAVKSHPLYGSAPTAYGNWNRLYDAIFQVPQTREMFLRRMRTFLDTWVKPPGTPTNQLPIEARILAWRDLIADEANRDRNWWGWAPDGGQNNLYPDLYITNGVNELLTNFVAARRQHFYGKHSVTNTALPIGNSNADNAGIPLSQSTNATVSIVGWDYNPASGNQDEEYLVLTNANGYAVDISGWKLAGGITHILQPGTVIPAGGSLYLSPNSRAFRTRTLAPKGGMGLFVQGGYNGHLNAWGETLTLTDDTGRLVSSNSFVGTPSLAQQFLRVTEIMYNPSPAPAITNDAQLFEYLELRNVSTNVTLNLNGVRFTNGISFNFTGSAVTNLLPGQRVLLVRNQAVFTARYGGGTLIAGEFTGALSSSGETLRIEDAVGEKILEFAYNNTWYPITDGLGFSLVIVNDLAPWSTWDQKASWRTSGALGGAPGAADPAPPTFAPILVNEVLAHTDLPDRDSIELFNAGPSNVNIGGWYLTDDFYTPKKYRIPNGTTLNAGNYLVFNDTQFNTGSNAFLLSEYGEDAYLFACDANTNLTGYYHGWDFKASPNAVSFGRYMDSQTNAHFVLQSAKTLGGVNALPRVGPVVVSEIMYHPPDLPGAVDNDSDEFIELLNITGAPVPLFCTFTNEPGYGAAALTNTWRLRNAVDFDFPTNTTLAAGARLLVVSFNPTNAAQLTAFRSRYNVATNIPIFGPWIGKLDNSTEQIELKYPDRPDTGGPLVVPYVMVEQVDYADTAPWPAAADGLGNSLQRFANGTFGNDPTNWFAGSPTPGQPNVANALPTVSLTSPANGSQHARLPGITLTAAPNDPDGSISQVTFYDGGTPIKTLNSAPWTYFWTNAPFGMHSLKAGTLDNLGGIAESTVVSITVTSLPPSVTLVQPVPGTNIVFGTSVTLSATASDPDSAVASVDFFDNGNLIGAVPAPVFSMNWTPSVAGNHVISAVARDEGDGLSAPDTAAVFVQATLVNPVLVPFGAVWSYHDKGVDLGTNWIAPQYNDTTWSNGPARLGYNTGSGNAGIATVLGYGSNSSSKYPTYYFRTKFVLESVTGITNLLLEFNRDDGVVFYLNGVELHRNSIATGAGVPVLYTDWAADGLDNGATTHSATLPATNLVAGTNVLATEIHQNQPASSDIILDARLSYVGTIVAPGITSQPQSLTRTNGQSATFNVTAAGTAPFDYQWFHAGTNLPGTDDDSFYIAPVTTNHAGGYFVTAVNAAGSVTSVVATLTVVLGNSDSDGDGMPDAWESANGTNPGLNDANSDPDGDGMINLNEYWSGTSPTNATSVLRFNSVLYSGGNVVFNFTAVSNRGYTLQSQPALGGGWQKWLDVGAASSNRTLWLTNATTVTNRYYRLVTPIQP